LNVWWSFRLSEVPCVQSLLALAPVMVPVQLAVTAPGLDDGVSVPESEGELAKAGSRPTVVTAAIESARVVRRRCIVVRLVEEPSRVRMPTRLQGQETRGDVRIERNARFA